MSFYIGADLGTSALKLVLAYADGTVVNSVVRSYAVSYPHEGWSEQDPEVWWQAFVSGVKDIIADVDANEIKGIGVAGQMHGLVMLDAEDRVIRPAILWNDGRCGKQTDFFNCEIGREKLSELTANIAFAGFTAPKILWVRENEQENYRKIKKIMLPKDYINYRLTGVHSTDYSDASGTLLLDVKNGCWSNEMLDICGIKPDQMPKLYSSSQIIGIVVHQVSSMLGLGENVTVVAGAGDNAAAAVGTGTVGNGKCNISLGTSGTIFISTDEFKEDKINALHSFRHADGRFHIMGCILSAAACNKWFCDEILRTDDYAAEQERIDIEINSNLFFLPYLMGERSPINDSQATGLFIGLRPNTTREEMLLAILEGVAFAVRDNLEAARKIGVSVKSSTLCGGGAKSELWSRILCNVLNIELTLLTQEEGPGLGAALLAAAGCENSGRLKPRSIKIKKILKPESKLVNRYEEKYEKYKNIYPAVKELYKKLR